MPLRLLTAFACLVAALALIPVAPASLTMYMGAAEDEGRNADPLVAAAKLELARAAGLEAIRITAIWTPGLSELPLDQLEALRSIAADVVQRTTIREVIVGNEPNLNRYWLPQFGRNGEDVAAPAYEALLAQAYDAIKAVDPTTFVLGGSVSPRGQDDATAVRHTHSPTAFIADIGAAYRASGRLEPIMDGFAFHPYGESSSTPPDFLHPRSTSIGLGDYPKLVSLLGRAFNGTAQLGSRLPIVYDEYGIDTVIPARKASFYHGREPTTTRPVSESLQAERYSAALLLAACQPTVRGFLIFHVTDETDYNRWQSGLYYADGTPKASRALVKETIGQVRGGDVECYGNGGTVGTRSVRPGTFSI